MSKEPVAPHEITQKFIYDNFHVFDGVVTRCDGYIGSLNKDKHRQFQIRVDDGQMTVVAHHIAWFLYKGSWPSYQLDHKDRNKENNVEDNLRYSNNAANTINKFKKSDLPPGVKLKKNGRYEAYIRYNGKKIYCGSGTLEQAAAAYVEMYQNLYDEDF